MQQHYRRRLLIVRHGERVDNVFGRGSGADGWVNRAFDEETKYSKFDINMPDKMPCRANNKKDWVKDSNLTQTGYIQATITGKQLGLLDVGIDHVISSPALRCVRTAHGIVKGIRAAKEARGEAASYERPIRIDPALYEYGFFSKAEQELPTFLTPDEIIRHYKCSELDRAYVPSMKAEQLSIDETLELFHERSHEIVKHVLSAYTQPCTILLSTHAPNFEPLTRQLCGLEPRPWDQYRLPMRSTPYLAMICAEERSPGQWEMSEPPVPCFGHNNIDAFNYDEYMSWNNA